MAQYGEEHVIGRVASETSYDPTWETPTWFDLWNLLEENGIEEFAITPLGRIGSDRRKFGSTQVITTKEDVMNVLEVVAKEEIDSSVLAGSSKNADDVRAARAIIWIDPYYSARLTEKLCFLMEDIVHLTGWAIKSIR